MQCKVSFKQARIKDIVKDTMFSEFLPMQRRATYIRNFRVPKSLFMNDRLFPLLEKLGNQEETRKNLRIFHLDCHVLDGSIDEDMMLMAEAVGFLIKNSKKTSPYHAPSFYNTVKLVLTDLK